MFWPWPRGWPRFYLTPPAQVRDLGALNLHIGKRTEGFALLEGYLAWLEGGELLGPAEAAAGSSSGGGGSGGAGGGAGRARSPALAGVVAEVLQVQRRKVLESSFTGAGKAEVPTEFMTPDLE